MILLAVIVCSGLLGVVSLVAFLASVPGSQTYENESLVRWNRAFYRLTLASWTVFALAIALVIAYAL